MKSNIEYLKESIKNGTDDCGEWIEAVEGELKEVQELKTSVKYLEKEKDTLESEISYYEEQQKFKGIKTIDCGIGIIEYVEPDNLKLRCLMEEFKEKHSVSYA